MKNKTTIDTCIIENIAAKAGASLDKVLIIIDSSMTQRGRAELLTCGKYRINLRNDWALDTLAHELKHIEQMQSGLLDFMVAEKQLTDYKDQWHELEAREFAAQYK